MSTNGSSVARRLAGRLPVDGEERRRARSASRSAPRRGSDVPGCSLFQTGHWSPCRPSRSCDTPARCGVSAAISSITSAARRVGHRIAEPRRRELEEDLEVPTRPFRRRHRLAHHLHAPLGVRERPRLLEEARAGEHHVREARRHVLEDVVNDEQLERPERLLDVMHVGIGLRDVLAEDVHALQLLRDRGVEHLGDGVPALFLDGPPPARLELRAYGVVGRQPVHREVVRERAHVARPLHVVLAAEGVRARAGLAEVPREDREVRQACAPRRPPATAR